MLSGAILGRVDRTMAERAVRGNRPLEMSKPTYRELATNFDLWCKTVLLEEQVSEREFNEMSVDEKLDILQGCFGQEIHDLRALILVLIVFADELTQVSYSKHGIHFRPMSALSRFRILVPLVVVVKLLCGGSYK